MSQPNTNTNRLELVTDAEAVPQGSERKLRRLAGTITDLQPHRPRLPLQVDTAAVFDTSAWQAKWRAIKPGADATSVYVAGCSGTIALGKRIGAPVLKPGTATDVELNHQRYGGLVIRDCAMVEEKGFTDWEASKLSARPSHPASPVRVLPRALLVLLSPRLAAQDFEALFVAALEPVTLADLAASPAGKGLRQRCGGPDHLLRYSRTCSGPALATEIACIGPSADAGRLVTLIEWMLIRIVLGDDGKER